MLSSTLIKFSYTFEYMTPAARIQKMMDFLGIEEQVVFADLAGASRSVVNQWLTGKIKSIDARYAFKLQDSTGFNAKWIMLGEGAVMKAGDDPFLNQLILFYNELSDDGKHALAAHGNLLHSLEHPKKSPATPFIKPIRKSVKDTN